MFNVRCADFVLQGLQVILEVSSDGQIMPRRDAARREQTFLPTPESWSS